MSPPSNTTAPKTTRSNVKSESTYDEKEKPRQIRDCNIPSPKATAVCDALRHTLGPKVMNKMEVCCCRRRLCLTPVFVVNEQPSPQANSNSGRIEELLCLAEAHKSLALALERRTVAERRFGQAVKKRLIAETFGLQHKATAEWELAAAVEQRVAAQAREAGTFEGKHWSQGTGRKPSRGSTSVGEALAASARALEAQDAFRKEVATTPPVVMVEEPSPLASSREDLLRLAETHHSVALALERRAVVERRFGKDVENRLIGEARDLHLKAEVERDLAIWQRGVSLAREMERGPSARVTTAAPGKHRLRVPPWRAAAATTIEMTQRLNRALEAQDAPRTVDRHISGIAKSQDIEAGDETTGNPTVNPLDSRAKFIPFQKGTIFLQGDDGVTVTHKGPIVWFDTGRRDKNSMPSL